LQHPIRELPKEQINLLAILVKNMPLVKGGKNQSFDVQLLVPRILNLTVLQQSTNFNSRTLYRTVTAKFLCDRALAGLNLCNVRQQVSSFQYDYI